jgi:hypothetical protein
LAFGKYYQTVAKYELAASLLEFRTNPLIENNFKKGLFGAARISPSLDPTFCKFDRQMQGNIATNRDDRSGRRRKESTEKI